MSDSEKPEVSFEKALGDLEEVVKALEAGDLPLERAVALYERGTELSAGCRQQLEAAQTRIEILMDKGRAGVTPQPFEP